jgi:hypothetical protein
MKIDIIPHLLTERTLRRNPIAIKINLAVEGKLCLHYKYPKQRTVYHVYKWLANKDFIAEEERSTDVGELICDIMQIDDDTSEDIEVNHTLAGQFPTVWNLISEFDSRNLSPSAFLSEAIDRLYNATPEEMIAVPSPEKADEFTLFCTRLELEELRLEKNNPKGRDLSDRTLEDVCATLHDIRRLTEEAGDLNQKTWVPNIKLAIQILEEYSITAFSQRDNRSERGRDTRDERDENQRDRDRNDRDRDRVERTARRRDR